MEAGSRSRSTIADVRRKKLRGEMSVSEKVFWEAVRKDRLGYRFRRQVAVGHFYLDFYCAAAQLAVEIDGEQHQQAEGYDAWRDAQLSEAKIEVMRVPSMDLFDPNGIAFGRWLEVLQQRCEARVAEFSALRDRRRGL